MKKEEIVANSLALIEQADTAYLATLDDQGFPQTRGMLNLRFTDQFPDLAGFMEEHAAGFATYFTTNTSSAKIRQIRANNKCSVYYNMGYDGVTLLGTIEAVTDEQIKSELWQDGWELYYPKGKKDPDYSVLKFTPARLRYFHSLKVTEIEL